jgi:hypothetical protein
MKEPVMQNSDWIALLGRIPADKHDCLCLLTRGGLHINMQSIIRKDPDVLVMRGRIGGSTDYGNTFLLPYDQMECIYLHKPVPEAEVTQWFAGAPAVIEIAPAAAAAQPAADGSAPVPPAPVPVAAASAAAPGGLATSTIQTKSGSIPLPGKAAILERLRKRTGSSSPGTIPKPSTGSSPGTPPEPPK